MLHTGEPTHCSRARDRTTSKYVYKTRNNACFLLWHDAPKSEATQSCWLRPFSATISINLSTFLRQDTNRRWYFSIVIPCMKLGIFRHPFHPEEKWLLRKWNTSCTNPNHEMKETEKGETTWVGESPSYFLRAQPVQSKDERVGCYRVTIQVESRVTVLGQKRRASVFNTHRSFPGKILTCKIISAE